MHAHSLEYEVLKQAQAWFAAGEDVLLVTLTHTWGSAPRPIGSMLAISGDGKLSGSVSGGCIEDDLIADYVTKGMRFSSPQKREYGVSADQAHRFGLPCGGTIRLILESVSSKSRLQELLTFLDHRRLITRELNLESGEADLVTTTKEAPLSIDDAILRVCFGPTHRLFLIGAGQMSTFVATNAIALGYEVVICDPREEHRRGVSTSGVMYSTEMPDDLIIRSNLDARAAVIALAHDPKLDDLALMEALRTPAFYVAAIGSRKNNAARKERLKEFDLEEAQLERLCGPAGLDIGALTPAEIAISILAELTAYRHGFTKAQAVSVARGKSRRERLSLKRSLQNEALSC